MKTNFLPIAMILLILIFAFSGSNSNAQLPFPKSPAVSAMLTLQPNISGKCIGDTVHVPIRISGDAVWAVELSFEFDHNVLGKGPGSGFVFNWSGFNTPIFTYTNASWNPNFSYLLIETASIYDPGTDFNNDKLIDLVFVYKGGTTPIHFRLLGEPSANPPFCMLLDEVGSEIAPVTYTDNIATGYPDLPASVSIAAVPPGPICPGTSVTFTATPTNGGTAPTYQWMNGAAPVSGATDATYTSSTLATGNVITVVMTSNASPCLTLSPATSAGILMTVNPFLPAGVSIAAVPSGAICQGTSVTFTATPTNGGTPSYQWKNGGTDIPGATNAAYTSATLANGNVITVVMTSTASPCLTGSPVTSAGITMVVNPISPTGVSIAAVPSGPVCDGTSVTFTATPTYGGTPSYQWKIGSTEIPGATDATYTSSTLVSGNVISVVMTSSETCATGNPATSAGITMIVNPLLPADVSITAVPSGPVCAGTSVTFTALPVNGGTPSYQWMNGVAEIPGATDATYTSTTLANGNVITVVMTSGETCATGNPVTSNGITMIVNPLLPAGVSITAVPSGPVCAGTSVTFTAVPVNEGPAPIYQWKNGASEISGATDAAYTSTTLADGDVITVVMTSDATPCLTGSPATSSGITMTVNALQSAGVAIAAVPPGAVCAGTSVTFTATPVNGGTAPAYQWMNGATQISGATDATYTSTTLANGNVISVVMTSNAAPCLTGSPATSAGLTMFVNPVLTAGVSIAAVPSGPVCAGTSVTFTASPVNEGTAPTYQWMKGAAEISGATDVTYTSATLSDGDVITVVMTSNATPCLTGSPATSSGITMTVNALQPAGVTIAAVPMGAICAGESVTFTATPFNGGTAPAYQWINDGTPISGATDATYTTTTLTNSNLIEVVMTSNAAPCLTGSPVTSEFITMFVDPVLTAGVSIEAVPSGPVCAGTSVTFTASPVNEGTAPTYQWMNGAVEISGATDVAYTSATLADGDVIAVVMTSNAAPCLTGSPVTSDGILMKVNPLLPANVTIAAVPSGSICAGTSVTFTASPFNGGTTPAYQWKNNGAEISGATDATYTSATLADGNVITVVMTSNATPCLTGSPIESNGITMTVNDLLPVSVSIAAEPSGAVCDGTTVTYTATPVNGGVTPSYQWKVNGGDVGSDSPTLARIPANNDLITCILTSSEACTSGNLATAAPLTAQINPPLVVGTVGPAQIICAGETPILLTGTVPNGTSPTYQWQSSLNNSTFENISGATMQTYQPGALTVTTYYRQEKDAIDVCGGPLTTPSIAITVNPLLPVGVSIAASANPVCQGASVTFTATPDNGGTNPTYQWKVNETEVSGATDATYSFVPADGSRIICEMTSNATCTTGNLATSNQILMVVNELLPVSVSISASALTVCGGTSVTYNATPTHGGTSPAYQWKVNNIDISGATNGFYSNIPDNNDKVTCLLTSSEACTSGNPAISNELIIVVDPPLVVGTITPAQTICSGTAPALLTGSAPTGTAPTYRWESSLDNNSFVNINGATMQSYQPGVLTATTYYRQIQDATGVCGGPKPTPSVAITVNPVFAVGRIDSPQTICTGTAPAELTGTSPTGGSGTYTYQWQQSVNNVDFADISGATDLNYLSGTLSATTYYRQIQSGTCGGPLATNTIVITVNPHLSVGAIHNDQTICAGEIPAELTCEAPNGTSPTYQWQSSLNNTTFNNIDGATVLNYQPEALTASDGPRPTASVTITVNPLLAAGVSITAVPAGAVCAGTSVTFTAAPVNGGTNPTYQWKVNGTDVSGATDAAYTSASLLNGNVISVVMISNASPCSTGSPATSNPINMIVNPLLPVSVSIVASAETVCGGATVIYTATPTHGGTTPVYQWKVNNIDMSGATNASYSNIPANNDKVTCLLTSSEACVTGNPALSNELTISVDPPLVVGTVGPPQTICAGTAPAELSGTPPTGTSPTYKWESSLDNSSFENINGATMQTYQPGALTVTTYYRQMQDASGVCGGPLPTPSVEITVNPSFAVGHIEASSVICKGTAPAELTGTPPTGGNGLYAYQWQVSTDGSLFADIDGATNLNYQPGTLEVTTYYLQIQNGSCGGPRNTNTVIITVNPLLAPGKIHADQTICEGNIPAELTGEAPNGTLPTYQWQSSLNNVTFNNIDGATVLNYQPAALTATTYYRQIQGASGTCGGPLATDTVTITVTPRLVVGSIGDDQTICTGTIPAELKGVSPAKISLYSYQWQYSTDHVNYSDIVGAKGLDYQPDALTVTTYFRQLQDKLGTCGGPLPTNVVTIAVTPDLLVGSISADQDICVNTAPAELKGVAPLNGTNPTYQWKSSLDNMTFTNIDGATALNYQPGVLSDTTYFVQMQNASGACSGPLPTNVVRISVGVYPDLIVGSIADLDQVICAGTAPLALTTISPPVNGTLPTYQWQSSLNNSTFTNINGATTATYQPGVLNVTTYYREMQNAQGTCGGPLPTNSVKITVKPMLLVGSIKSSQAICSGNIPQLLSTISPPLNGTSPTYQWQSSLNNSTFANITGATTTTYQPGALTVTTYYRQLQDADGTCGGPLPTASVTITVKPPLAVGSISANQSICMGTVPALLHGVAPSNGTSPTYQWQSSPVVGSFANINGATALNYQPGALTATTKFRQMQSASGTCGSPLPTNTVTITVNPLPTAVITPSGPTTFCAGGSVILTASGGTSYLWSNAATTAAITVTASGTYTVTVTNASNCKSTASTTVTVNPLPTAVITPNGPTTFCAGGSVILTASGGTSYLWSNAATTAAITVTASGTYTVTVTNASNCSSTASRTVTVNPLPTAVITPNGPTTFCAGGSVILTASGGTSYLWSNAATTAAITVTASGTYTVTVTNASNCSGTASTTVTVNPLPTAVITPSGPTTFCAGGSVILTASGGTSYLWSNAATTAAITVTASGTYTVTVTNASNCSSTASRTVTVNPLPTAVITPSGPTTFCTGGSVILTASGGTSYLWSNAATTAAITVTASGTYTVTVTNASNCSSTASRTVTVNPLPTAVITPSGPTTFCAGGSVILTASGGTSYLWSNAATTAAITVTASGTYTVTVTNASNCSSTASSTVTVNPLPTAVITPNGPTTFCAGGSVILTASGGTSYLWSNAATTAAITVTASGTYTVTVTNASNCSSTASTTVTVNPVPVPVITGPAAVCQGATATYTTQAGMTNYTWTFSSGGTLMGGGGTSDNFITIKWNGLGPQTVTVNYTSI
ncbi:MAG: hypothetical protein NTW16_16730 [Bacteroidetes bacterium]|nr:hypothetical protein [Bacteroidota bacterium]